MTQDRTGRGGDTPARVTLGERLAAITDRKERGRTRVAEVVKVLASTPLEWTAPNGWRYVLDRAPEAHTSRRDAARLARSTDLRVWDGDRLVFRDRILAWDGGPIMVREGDALREDPQAAMRADIEHTVTVVTKGGAQPHVKAKPGTVSTFFGDTADGLLTSNNATYSIARSGSGGGSASTSDTLTQFGQVLSGTYFVYQIGLAFDTSSLGSDVVSDAVLSVYHGFSGPSVDFVAEARLSDWGASLTFADFIAGASLSGATLLADYDTWFIFGPGYVNLVSKAAFPGAVVTSGFTRINLSSAEQRLNSAPAGNETLIINLANQAGTTQDPKLVVTHEAPIVTLAASASTVSTVAGALAVEKPLAAEANSTSAASGALAVNKPLAASSASLSTVAGALAAGRPLAAAPSTQSVVEAILVTSEVLLAASAATASSVSASMLMGYALGASPATVSTVAADMDVLYALAAQVAAQSGVSADMVLNAMLAAAATTTSIVTAVMIGGRVYRIAFPGKVANLIRPTAGHASGLIIPAPGTIRLR